MCFLLSFKIQQAVSTPEFVHAHWAHWLLVGLAVLHQQVAHADTAARHAWGPRAARAAWLALEESRKERINWVCASINDLVLADIPAKLHTNSLMA